MSALMAAPTVRFVLRRRGYQAATSMLRGRVRTPAADGADPQRIAKLAEAAILRLPGTYSCLERSLVVWWLVGGDPTASVRLGVAPAQSGEAPRFHAWVEAAGSPINDRIDIGDIFLPLSGTPMPERFD